MNQGLYSGVAAMGAAERRLEAIASNLANVDVHGFKRLGTSTAAFDLALAGRVERQVRTDATFDFTQGTLEPTGNAFDLALAGRGFFAVETPEGEAYTRDGRFHVDDQGVLQSLEGWPVAWEGSRGTIDPQGVEPTVDATGQVWQDRQLVGRLRLVDFAGTEGLALDRGGNFRAPRGLAERTALAEVRQGALERSNVSAVDEMVALIRVQRGFESAARMLGMIEQSYRRLNQAR